MSVIWNNLTFKSDVNNVQKLLSTISCGVCLRFNPRNDQEILKSVFGSFNRGELVALMGPSGAGKSTLLNCLTQGKNCKGCEGAVYVSGLQEPVRASFINQNECEHLLFSLTVAQSLKYASRLKNPPETPNGIHEDIAKNLINELDLKACENTAVDRCSGGQKKRLAIGLELTALKKPHFLFLDEPTSGLDSYVGLKVVKLLSDLARVHNMAIVATIHQPSYKLFTHFNKAFILSGTGEFIFHGQPPLLRDFLRQSGYNFQQGCNENPADVAIELASAMKRQGKVTSKVKNDRFTRIYFVNSPSDYDEFQSEASDSTTDSSQVSILEDSFEAAAPPESEHGKICRTMVTSMQEGYTYFLRQHLTMESNTIIRQEEGLCKNGSTFKLHSLWVLFLRCAHTSILKQKQLILIRLALHFVVAVVLAALYNNNVGEDDSCTRMVYPDVDPQNCSCLLTPETLRGDNKSLAKRNVNFQFFSLLFLMFASLMPTVLAFPSEIKLFLNEFRNGWYSTTTYYIAKTITEIPFQLLFPMMYVYFLYSYSHQIGMDNWYGGIIGFMSSRYSQFLWVTLLCCFIAQGLGFLIGVLCVRSFNISIIVSSSVLLFLFLFSGFFVKRVEMGDSVSWITYFSFIRFGLEAILLVIYGKKRCQQPFESSILAVFDLKDKDYSFNVWMLITHLIVIRLLAFMVLKYNANPNVLKLDYRWVNNAYNYLESNESCLKFFRKFMGTSTVKTIWLCLAFLGIQLIIGVGLGVYFLIKGIVS